RLVPPVVPAPAHREELLIPDDLLDDLEANPDEPLRGLDGVAIGMPDIPDRKARDERERLRPVHPRVARDGGVAVAACSSVSPHGGSCRRGVLGFGINAHVGLLGGTKRVVDAIAPRWVE